MAPATSLSVLLAAAAALLLAGSAAAALPPLAGYKTPAQAATAARQLAGLNPKMKRQVFDAWKRTSGKTYSGAEDADRFKKWNAALNAMVAWNRRPNVKFVKSMNQFSDRTFKEFADKLLMKKVKPGRGRRALAEQAQQAAAGSRRKLSQDVPDEWDWRTEGKVPPVRPHQGECSSCWAYAAIAALESRALIERTNQGPNLSEQQILDCVSKANGYQSNGCSGGIAEDAFDYISKRFSATDFSYPYTATSTTGCRDARTSTSGAMTVGPAPGYDVVVGTAQDLMEAVYNQGPVVVYFNVEDSFVSYDSGIYPASACKANDINHAMVIVGYSKAEMYWIVRNSWGDKWGEGGYAKVEMTLSGVGACALYMWGGVVPLQTRRWTRPSPPPPKRSPPPRRRSPPPPPPPSPSPAFEPSTCVPSTLYFGVELVGGNDANNPYSAGSYGECCDLCSSTSGCLAWTYFPPSNLYAGCWLKLYPEWGEGLQQGSGIVSGIPSPTGTRAVVALEGDTAVASCPEGEAISSILDAHYGRNAANATATYSTVMGLCLGESSCSVLATDSTFNAVLPPNLYDKRLKFSYECY